MKTVREVLRALDTERLLETYVYDHPIEFYKLKVMDLPASEIYRRYKDLYREFLERLRAMEIRPMEGGRQGILFVSRYLKDKIDENTYELIFRDELLEKGVKCESYAYEFTPQAEILGFLVADTPRTQDHIYELMADTLHEASFFGFQQEALDEELKRLKEAEKEAEAGLGIDKALKAGAVPIEEQMKANASSDPKIISGDLYSSIHTHGVRQKRGGSGKHITIGVKHSEKGAFYANPVEWGHGGPAPAPMHPFVRPAFDVRYPDACEEIKRVLRDALKP